MFPKIIALCLVLGLVLADPVPEISSPSAKESGIISALLFDTESSDVAMPRVLESTVILDLLNAVVGYKFSALQIAVDVIDWLVSQSGVIVFGLLATFGFCKLTDKCNFDYEQYVPVNSIAQFRSLATPQRLEQAEQFFVTAVEKYAEKRRRRSGLPLNAL